MSYVLLCYPETSLRTMPAQASCSMISLDTQYCSVKKLDMVLTVSTNRSRYLPGNSNDGASPNGGASPLDINIQQSLGYSF